MSTSSWGFSTRQVHAGWDRDAATGATSLPIHQTSSFAFESPEQAAQRFALNDFGPIYTRIGNPTLDAVEARIAALEGGVAALLTASGQAAISIAVTNLGGAGSNVVSSPALYGGTVSLLRNSLTRFGIEVRFVEDQNDPAQWQALADEKTIAFFAEVIPNPAGSVLDIEAIADAAHHVGVPLIVDNTVPTPYLTRPIEWGADIVVHSATKALNGHGNAIAGVIVDSGNFDYTADPARFPYFNEPDASYHGVVFGKDFGAQGRVGVNVSYIVRARTVIQRDFGFALSPFNAFLLENGIQTLSLRVDRQVDNALALAKFLEAHPDVESVTYCGLESSPYKALQEKYAPRGGGGLLSFVHKGGYQGGKAFIDALQLIPTVANIGDAKTLAIHPASTTHSQLSAAELEKSGVNAGTVRISVGIEDVEDLIADLQIGFDASK